MKIELIAKEGIKAEVEFIAMDSSDLQRVYTPSNKETAFSYKAV